MKRTVFVVGAAGSLEFDTPTGSMPVGSQLAVQIETLLTDEIKGRHSSKGIGPIATCLARSGGLTDDHYAVMSRIRSGVQSRDSIDQFINDCQAEPNVADIAKLCIAHLILKAEAGTKLKSSNKPAEGNVLRETRSSWLSQILRLSAAHINRQNVEQWASNLAFITFNYDRCIERYIWLWIEATLSSQSEKTSELAQLMPVKHVYGTLGELYGTNRADNAAPFGGGDENYTISAAKRIKTFTEELMSSEAAAIQNTLEGADTIVFLGCAYHRQNLRLLFPNGPPSARVFGTSLGMRPKAIQDIQAYFTPTQKGKHFEQAQCGEFIDRVSDDIF